MNTKAHLNNDHLWTVTIFGSLSWSLYTGLPLIKIRYGIPQGISKEKKFKEKKDWKREETIIEQWCMKENINVSATAWQKKYKAEK